MSKQDPLIVALLHGESYTFTIPDGGDLASMRARLKYGQKITMSPPAIAKDIEIGDVVVVKWKSGYIIHVVQEISEDRFLIANSLGKIR